MVDRFRRSSRFLGLLVAVEYEGGSIICIEGGGGGSWCGCTGKKKEEEVQEVAQAYIGLDVYQAKANKVRL
jgi:hypothetical protein